MNNWGLNELGAPTSSFLGWTPIYLSIYEDGYRGKSNEDRNESDDSLARPDHGSWRVGGNDWNSRELFDVERRTNQ